MAKNTKKKLAAVMFCKFVDYDKYVANDKKLAIKILSDYDSVITKDVKKYHEKALTIIVNKFSNAGYHNNSAIK